MRLLVCDDDPSVGAFLSSVFAWDAWTVVTVTSGPDCIAAVNQQTPDVIVLDQVMPEMTGIEAARVIRGNGYTKPIVLFSAYLTPELRPAVTELDLREVSKADTEAVVRILYAFEAQLQRS
jgi:CheY-like chemotaxis protein